MKNFWLQRRPQIVQQLNPYADFYGKWYVYKSNDELYLHADGVWRGTTFNAGQYSGYFDTEEAAEETLAKSLGQY